jgi:hypothetical protein
VNVQGGDVHRMAVFPKLKFLIKWALKSQYALPHPRVTVGRGSFLQQMELVQKEVDLLWTSSGHNRVGVQGGRAWCGRSCSVAAAGGSTREQRGHAWRMSRRRQRKARS